MNNANGKAKAAVGKATEEPTKENQKEGPKRAMLLVKKVETDDHIMGADKFHWSKDDIS